MWNTAGAANPLFATYTNFPGNVSPYTYLPPEIDPLLPWNVSTGPDYNLLITAATPAGPKIVGPHLINSLKVASGAAPIDVAGSVLSLFSGGLILENQTGILDSAPTPNSGITAGGFRPNSPPPNFQPELIVHVPANSTGTISAAIVNNPMGDPVMLTKSGPGVLVLAPTQGMNTYTGVTTINQGILSIPIPMDVLGMPGGGPVDIQGGILEIAQGFPLTRQVLFGNRAVYNYGLGVSNAGAIRVLDGQILTLMPNSMWGGGSGMLRLTSDAVANPAGPLLNGSIDLSTSQANLQPTHTIILSDIVAISTDPNPVLTSLGMARIFVATGGRATANPGVAGDTNHVTRLNLMAQTPVKTLPNTIVMPSAFNHFYIDGGNSPVGGPGGNTVILAGDIERMNYNERVGEIVSAYDTKIILAGPPVYTGATGVGAASGEIEVRSANSWGGMIDNRNLNHLGNVTGARAQPDLNMNPANPRAHTVHFVDPAGGGQNQYYFSALVSESQVFNTAGSINGVKVPLTIEVDAMADVMFTAGRSGSLLVQAYDDIIKTGKGSVTLVASGMTSSQTTRAHNAIFTIAEGRVEWRDVLSNVGGGSYAGNASNRNDAGAGIITDLFFDGGNDNPQGIQTNGVCDYVLGSPNQWATMAAVFGTDNAGTGHMLHFDLIVNPSGLPFENSTIQVGDLPAAGAQARKPLTIGAAPSSLVKPNPIMLWGGTLWKTGMGELILEGPITGFNRTYTTLPGSQLTVQDGTVTIAANMGVPLVSANLTINVIGSAVPGFASEVVFRDDQDLAGITVLASATPGRQRFDLNTPNAPGVFRAIRDYALNPALEEASLWPEVCNANVAGAIDPLDGICDSGKGAHVNAAVGITDQAIDSSGVQHVLIRPTRLGDANCDGFVNFNDLLVLSQNYNGVNKTWDQADFTYDSLVGFPDLLILSQNYNTFYTAPEAGAVPAPSVLGLLGVAAAALLGGRRRRAA